MKKTTVKVTTTVRHAGNGACVKTHVSGGKTSRTITKFVRVK